MELTINTKIMMNNQVEIPIFGFGTWELEGKLAFEPVKWALKSGYRLIDTAAVYKNEESVGRAIKESGIERDDLFITSKVWNSEQGYENTINAYNNSLKRLGLDFIDLYLIHWPTRLSKETWSALETIYNDGKVKAVGVSNFKIKDFEEILTGDALIPTINQILMHPLKYQENKNLVDYCRSKNIKIEAYSPLIHGYKLDLDFFQEIANRYNKTVPQILIRWSLQNGFICIPRSSNINHIKENASVFDFELSESDIKRLNSH
jgi:diketogulonate reductase-like aldo/keto reductase